MVARLKQAVEDNPVALALRIIEADYARPLSVPALAKSVGLSPSRFAHLFKQQVGCSPARYLKVYRLGQGLPAERSPYPV